MKKTIINQCDFCTKTSFNKASIKAHEKKCFYNPITQSCATCLWFSKNHVSGLSVCFVGESFESVKGVNHILRTRCNKWINTAVVEDIDVMENEYGILNQIIAGDPKTLETISRIKAGGESYYGENKLQSNHI